MSSVPISDDILRILRCPQTLSPLARAPEAAVAELNGRIRQQLVRNQAGDVLERELNGLLINGDQSLAYPVHAHGPTLIADEALRMAELGLTGPWRVPADDRSPTAT